MFESTPVYPSPAPYWMMAFGEILRYAEKLTPRYTALSTRLDEMLEVEWTEEQHNDQVLRELDQLAPPFLAESPQGENVLPNWKAEVSVSQVPQDFPGSAIHMVNDNAEVFEVGQKMPDDVLDVIGRHTRHPDVALHHRLDQLADRTTFFPRHEVVRAPLPAATTSHHTHKNYGATMDASTEDPGFHDLGWIACSLTIANPSVVTLHTASLAPSRPSSRIHCVHGGVGGAYTLILVDCVRDRLKPLSVTIKLPAHAFSAHDDGVDGANTCGPRVGVDVLDVEARVLSAEGSSMYGAARELRNTSYSPYASQRAAFIPVPLLGATSPRPCNGPTPARGASCERVPCGVDHGLRIEALLSHPGTDSLFILPPHRLQMRNTWRAPDSVSPRDVKEDMLSRLTSDVDLRTEGDIHLISIRNRHILTHDFCHSFDAERASVLAGIDAHDLHHGSPSLPIIPPAAALFPFSSSSTSSFVIWHLTRIAGDSLFHARLDPLALLVRDATLESPLLCADFSVYQELYGYDSVAGAYMDLVVWYEVIDPRGVTCISSSFMPLKPSAPFHVPHMSLAEKAAWKDVIRAQR
ncbi:hypothetical protein DFH08DRAFT_955454 [Mycena albidolilacea]|uniref:Uncharacterized protein n=1 Tax=Mycena albidolilacea TaxID=1033008 RepID=A0AAD7EWK9_9AGAR|nr:hypothetical protein DFH08DRAFT_955454 [Mycena albidolilacea]